MVDGPLICPRFAIREATVLPQTRLYHIGGIQLYQEAAKLCPWAAMPPTAMALHVNIATSLLRCPFLNPSRCGVVNVNGFSHFES